MGNLQYRVYFKLLEKIDFPHHPILGAVTGCLKTEAKNLNSYKPRSILYLDSHHYLHETRLWQSMFTFTKKPDFREACFSKQNLRKISKE